MATENSVSTNSWTTNTSWINNPSSPIYQRVAKFYTENHSQQTLEYVLKKKEQYKKLDRATISIWNVIEWLDNVVDQSDPDLSLAQIVHCFQTAEALRRKYPEEQYDWIHLVGLIHDCGKILVKWGEPQWSVVGDTYPVGCTFKHSPKMDYPNFFHLNPDCKTYSTDLGIYTEGCGFDNIHMSFGHDEYFYHVLKENQTTLPEEALYIVRYHSFWYWHFGGEYNYFMSEKDKKMLPYLEQFRQCDLYSKDDVHVPDIEALKPYYQKLIDKYLPKEMKW